MLYKRSRRTEEKNAEALLSALLREVMPDGGKIPVRQLSDGRARAQLREKPFLALEVETFRAEAKSRTGAIRPTRSGTPGVDDAGELPGASSHRNKGGDFPFPVFSAVA